MGRSLFGLAVTFVSLLLSSCTANSGSFSLVNRTNEPITRATVTVCGQTIELKDIKPAKSAVGSYKVTSDSHYTVHIEFLSGKKLDKETGYVTNGMDFRHEITVTDRDIEVTGTNIR